MRVPSPMQKLGQQVSNSGKPMQKPSPPPFIQPPNFRNNAVRPSSGGSMRTTNLQNSQPINRNL